MRTLPLLACLAAALAHAQPSSDDPLLAPVEPAARQLESWDEAVELLEAGRPDLSIAAAQVLRAQGQRRIALAALLPTITGTALASFPLLAPDIQDTGTAALFGAAPFQTLTLVGSLSLIDVRTWNALAQAGDAERAARLSREDARRLVMLDAGQSVLTLLAAERVAELNRVGLSDALARQRLTEGSARAGAATEVDLARARQDAEAARAQVVSGDEALRQARESLGQALGVDGPVGVAPSFRLDGLAGRMRERCRAIAGLDERPDVEAARAQVEVARKGEFDVTAQYIPSLALRSTAQVFVFPGPQGSTLFPIWNLQAVLTVPIWDGGARYGAARIARAATDEASARAVSAVRAARIDIARARRAVEVAEAARAIASRALDQAREVDRMVRRSFEAGLGTSLELVSAASALRSQQLTVALREYDVLRANVVALFALSECAP